MSKETILAKIQSNLAGQGSMIDLSGKLPEILGEIIELIPESGGVEPYIVQGAFVDDEHFSNDVLAVSQEEFARVKTAFLAGRPVVTPVIDYLAYLVIGYARDAVVLNSTGASVEGFTLQITSTTEYASAKPDALVVASEE